MLEARVIPRSLHQCRTCILRTRRPASSRLFSTTIASRSPRGTCRASSTSRVPYRAFQTSASPQISILDKDDNTAQQPEHPAEHVTDPTPLTDDDYHAYADQFLEQLYEEFEQMQEEKGDIDVEFAAGVLTVIHNSYGTYVLNKQPPNRQIWLSSPISGPKRYDWVVQGEGMHEKGGESRGDWVYLRDGSSLTRLLRKELDVDMAEWLGDA